MAASINGSQIQSAQQSLAAYLQALQTKAAHAGATTAAAGGIAVAEAATGKQNGKPVNNNDQVDKNTAQLDVITLSAQAQQILANAQAPKTGPGSLDTFLNTNNVVATIPGDPSAVTFEGAIAQFRQWLARPLGQPVPFLPGDAVSSDASKNAQVSGLNSISAPKTVGSTSA